jgi:hypothetical protein
VTPGRTAAAAVGFLVLVAAFVGPGAFWDRSLLVGDGLYYTEPSFRALAPHVFTTRPTNFLVDIDNTLQAYPFRHFTQASFARGEIPWWNPYIAMGMPFVGLGAGVFEPIAAVTGLVVPPEKLGNAVVIVGLLVGAAGMAGLLGALGASPAARALGSVAFAFGGWTVVWLGRINFAVELWMPWAFWAAERFLRHPTPGRAGALALTAALLCLPGYLQASFHALIALGVYAAARASVLVPRGRGAARVFAALVLAVSVGVTATACQIVPILDFVVQSDLPPQGRSRQAESSGLAQRLGRGLAGDWDIVTAEGPTLLTALSPYFFGAPQAETYWWLGTNFAETTVYVGVVPLGLAFYALWRRRSIPGVGAWLALAGAALAVACAAPVANLVNYLPGFDLVNSGRLRLVYHFAVVVAAALGLDRLLAEGEERRARRWAVGWAAVALLVPVAAHEAIAALASGVRPPSLPAFLARAEAPLLVVLVVFVVTTAAWARGRLGRSAAAAIVVALTYAELFWFLHDFNPSVPSAYVFPPTAVTRIVEADPGRPRVSSLSAGELMPPNTKLPYRIFDVDLFSVLTVGRYAALQRAVSPPAPASQSGAFRGFRFDPDAHRGLIDLMGIGYLVAPAGRADPFAGRAPYRLVYEREVKVYRNPEALPRAFLVERAVGAPDAAAALAAVTRPGFDPRATVVIEGDVGTAAPPAPDSGPAGAVDVRAFANNRIALRAALTRPAWLVLAEVHYPGWRAWVDGAEAPVARANYLFRAVHLGPGTHEVEFVFAPRVYALGTGLSVVGALGVAACLAWGPLGRRRRARAGP